MIGTDAYLGFAEVITAIAGLLGTVFAGIAALRTGQIKKSIDTNGDPRTIAQITTDTANHVGATVEASEHDK